MTKKKKLTILFCIVFAVGLVGSSCFLVSSYVFGAWSPKADLATMTTCDATVTAQKASAVPAVITGSAVTYPEIPTTKGKKGTATNPFVILEVVPHKAYQTLSYMTAGSEPFDLKEMASKITDDNYFGNNIKNTLPVFTNSYDVYDPSTQSYVYKSAYSVNKVEYKIDAAYYGSEAFLAGCATYGIEPTAIAEEDWSTQPASSGEKIQVAEGYFVCKDNGKGNYIFQSWDKKFNAVNYSSDDKKWVFVPQKPASGNELTTDTAGSAVTGDYVYVTNYEIPVLQYYNMHYEIKNNDVLKHKLFKFDTEQEYEDFNMQVIVVTPEQVNDMLAVDTTKTMEYLERADMFYLSQPTNIESKFFSFYYQWNAEGRLDANKDVNLRPTFVDHDIEWDGIMKMVKRLSENENLPLMIHSNLYTNAFTTTTHKYYYQSQGNYDNNRPQCDNMKCTTTNVAKLFMLAGQFNLESNGYFMQNYYSQLKKVKLNDTSSGVTYTGVYDNQEPCKCDISDAQKRENYYAWTLYTFYPFTYIAEENLKDYGYLTGAHSALNLNQEFTGRDTGVDTNYNIVGLNDNRSLYETELFTKQGTVLYEILNGLFKKSSGDEDELKPLEIVVKNTVASGSDVMMFVDLSAKGKYGSNDMLSIPFEVINENEGLEETVSVSIQNEDGDEKTISFTKKSTGHYVLKYPCQQFPAGYTKIVIKATVKSDTQEETSTKTVNLVERQLFELE